MMLIPLLSLERVMSLPSPSTSSSLLPSSSSDDKPESAALPPMPLPNPLSSAPGLLSDGASSRSLNSAALGADFGLAAAFGFGNVFRGEDAARFGFEVDLQFFEVVEVVGRAGWLQVELRFSRGRFLPAIFAFERAVCRCWPRRCRSSPGRDPNRRSFRLCR